MKVEKIVNIKFTEEELIKFIGEKAIYLAEDEDLEIVSYYSSLYEYKFKIVKKEDKQK